MKELDKYNRAADILRNQISIQEMKPFKQEYYIEKIKKQLENINKKIIDHLYRWQKTY